MQSLTHLRSRKRGNRRARLAEIQSDLAIFEFSKKLIKYISGATCDGVQSLGVSLEADRIVLTGYCESYYVKQMAQQAAMSLATFENVVNKIIVYN